MFSLVFSFKNRLQPNRGASTHQNLGYTHICLGNSDNVKQGPHTHTHKPTQRHPDQSSSNIYSFHIFYYNVQLRMHFDYKIETLCSVMLNMKYKVEISSYKPSARNIRHLVFFLPPPIFTPYHHIIITVFTQQITENFHSHTPVRRIFHPRRRGEITDLWERAKPTSWSCALSGRALPIQVVCEHSGPVFDVWAMTCFFWETFISKQRATWIHVVC